MGAMPQSRLGESTNHFWDTRKDTWGYPLDRKATVDPGASDNYFGCRRKNTPRVHAGLDFHSPVGAKVLAMEAGVVLEVQRGFYYGTDAVAIQHEDGTIARYCEIGVLVRKGDHVVKGHVIGFIKANQEDHQSMLHLEMYLGTATGPLSNPANRSDYPYVTVKEYRRRKDLIDPTGAKDLKMQ